MVSVSAKGDVGEAIRIASAAAAIPIKEKKSAKPRGKACLAADYEYGEEFEENQDAEETEAFDDEDPNNTQDPEAC